MTPLYRSANFKILDHGKLGLEVFFLTSKGRSPDAASWLIDGAAAQVRGWAAGHFQAADRMSDAFERDRRLKRLFQESMSLKFSTAKDLLPATALDERPIPAGPDAEKTSDPVLGLKERMRALTDEVRAILAECRVEDRTLFLPDRLLDRSEYDAVDKAIKAMGGAWSRRARGHVFPFPVGDLLAQTLDRGAVVDRRKTLQFFATPADLAAEMVAQAQVGPGERVLEPQAGLAAILAPLVATGAEVHAVEIDAHHVEHLRAGFPSVALTEGDFLTVAAAWRQEGRQFDAIVMNPPFSGGQDARHIEAAYGLLAPGGRLVALASPSPFTDQKAAGQRFRAFLESDGGARVIDIPAGTFRESGTSIATRLICKSRPPELVLEVEAPALVC